VVARLPDATRKERSQLLGQEIEELVVEAKRLALAWKRRLIPLQSTGSVWAARQRTGARRE